MDINSKISELFQNLLASGTTFVKEIDYNSKCIAYDLSGTPVILRIANYLKGKEPWDNKYSSFEDVFESGPLGLPWYTLVGPKDEYSLVFELIIKGKHYFVPKLSRVEVAKAIESIEESIQNYENTALGSVISTVLQEDDLL